MGSRIHQRLSAVLWRRADRRAPWKRASMLAALGSVVASSFVLASGSAAANTGVHVQKLRASSSAHLTTGQLTRIGETGNVMAQSSTTSTRTATPDSGAPVVKSASQPAASAHLLPSPTPPRRSTKGRDATVNGGAVLMPSVSCSPPGSGCDAINTGSGGASTNSQALNATANDNLYGLDVEPPDQGLCAGNGYVIEIINIGELQVFNASLQPVSGYTKLDTLMDLTTRGFSSGGDISCLYDPDNGGHWFISEIVSTNTEKKGGAFTGCFAAVKDACREGLAVSTNDDPLSTSWNIYFIDPNRMSPNDPGSGYLLNDYGKMATTRDALMFFYDEFILNPADIPACPALGCLSFNGAQELAFQKKALELGYNSINYVHENMGTDPFIQPPDGNCYNGSTAGVTCWAAIIPAQTPGGQFNNEYDGSGFMVGALDFNSFATATGAGDNRVAVFYWTGLANLNSRNCGTCQEISFGGQVFNGVDEYTNDGLSCPVSEGDPCGTAPQRLGTVDLGTYCGAMGLASVSKCPEQGITTNGDFAEQASYADGYVWFSLSTLINETFGSSSEIHTGAVYYVIGTGSFTGAQQLLTLTNQGYVAASHEDLSMPTLVGSTTGSGLITFTLTGNGGPTRADGGGFFPSSAYGLVSTGSSGLTGSTIYVADLGQSPQDGFTEYLGLPGPTRPRWGDYSAAFYVPGEGFYFADEMIQNANCDPAYWFKVDQSCGGTRDPFANFGTAINLKS